MRTVLWGVLACALVGAQDQQSFEVGLEKVRRLQEKGKWKPAQAELGKLLEEHGPEDYVTAAKKEIVRLVEEAAFRQVYPLPDPKKLVSGELVSWKPRSKKIKLRYTPGKIRDFQEKSGSSGISPELLQGLRLPGKSMQVHPARFIGKHSVVLEGRSYPKTGLGAQLFVCYDHGKYYEAMFGVQQTNTGSRAKGGWKSWTPARIYAHEGSSRNQLDHRETSPGRGGKSYRVEVKVGKTSISAHYGSRSVLRGKKDGKRHGGVGFVPVSGWKSLTISGTTDGRWIQKLIDRKDRRNRRRFKKTWKPAEHLPEWL